MSDRHGSEPGHGAGPDDWDDGRVDAAYGGLAAWASSTGIAESVVAAIRAPVDRVRSDDGVGDGPEPVLEAVDWVEVRRPGSAAVAIRRARSGRAWLAIAAALVIAAAAIGYGVVGQLSNRDSSGLHHFAASGLEFDYPASWSIHDQLPPSTGFGSTWAILGTHTWPSSCGASDINCYYEAKLEPGTIAVDVGIVTLGSGSDMCTLAETGADLQGRGPTDPIPARTFSHVDGRPAMLTTYAVAGTDYYTSDVWLDWRIAAAGTTQQAYVVNAMVRGPGTDAMRADLDRLIASIRITPELSGPGSADCGAPYPPIGVRATSPPAPTTKHADAGGIAVDYPLAWIAETPALEPGQTGTPILRVSSGPTLTGSGVTVSVALVDWPAGSPFVEGPPIAHLTMSNGIPVRAITDLARHVQTYDLLVPGSSDETYQIVATFSGPPDDALAAAADAFAYGARLHATLTPIPYPADPGQLDGVLINGRAAMDHAPGLAAADAALLTCMPFHSGGTVQIAVQLPATAPSTAPLPLDVTCTATVERSPAELWRMVFDASWAQTADRPAGHRRYIVYLDAQTDLAGRILVSGDPLPTR